MLKIFRGVEPTTKIFYTKFFHNEIISFENFPDYGTPLCIAIVYQELPVYQLKFTSL